MKWSTFIIMLSKTTATILVLIASIAYGTLSTVAKLAFREGFSAGQLVLGQISLAFIFFMSIALIKNYKFLFSLPRKMLAVLIVAGIISSMTSIFYSIALQYVDASLGIILLFQFTWLGMLLDFAVNKIRPGKTKLLALVFILTGTVMSINLNPQSLDFSLVGILFGLAAAVSYTLFIYFSGSAAVGIPVIYKNSIMLIGSMLTVCIAFPPQVFLTDLPNSSSWLKYSAYLATLGMILPFYFFARGVPVIGTTTATLIGAMELPTVLLCATFILNEQISAQQIAGMLCIIVGIIISNRSSV